MRYKRIGYNLNMMLQSACLVFSPITEITMLHSLIPGRWVGRKTLYDPDLELFILVGWGLSFFVCGLNW